MDEGSARMEALRPTGSHLLVSLPDLCHSQCFMGPLGSRDKGPTLAPEFSRLCDIRTSHPENTAGVLGEGMVSDRDRLGLSRTKQSLADRGLDISLENPAVSLG